MVRTEAEPNARRERDCSNHGPFNCLNSSLLLYSLNRMHGHIMQKFGDHVKCPIKVKYGYNSNLIPRETRKNQLKLRLHFK